MGSVKWNSASHPSAPLIPIRIGRAEWGVCSTPLLRKRQTSPHLRDAPRHLPQGKRPSESSGACLRFTADVIRLVLPFEHGHPKNVQLGYFFFHCKMQENGDRSDPWKGTGAVFFRHFMERARNAAICALVQAPLGSNLPPPMPVVMPLSTAQATACA